MNHLKIKQVSSLEKILPTAEPSGEGMKTRMMGLKGETVSFQIGYYWSGGEWQQGSVRVKAPAGPSVRVRRVELVPCAYPCHPERDEGYLVTEPGVYPDLLTDLGNGGFPLVPGQWRGLWIDLETDRETPGGKYPVEVILESPEGEALGCVSTELEVLEGELPPLPIPHTEWFHCDCLAQYYGVEVFSEAHWRIIENFVAHAVKRGCNMILTPIFTPPLDTAVGGERPTVQLVEVLVTEEGYKFSYERFERWVAMCQRCGMEFFEMAHLFTQWGAKAAPKIVARKDGREVKLFGWETEAVSREYGEFLDSFLCSFTGEIEKLGIGARCYFHISDEPVLEQLDSYRRAKDLVRERLEGYHVIDAVSDFAFFETGAVEELVCANDHLEPFLEHRPDKLWTYYCTAQFREVSNRFIALPGYRTRILGLQLYKYRINGFLHWGYNFYNSARSLYPIQPYQCTDAGGAFPSGDPFLVYPGRDGRPEDSQRAMLMEEAMWDLRAMSYLEQLTDRETVLNCLGEETYGALTFKKYPQSNAYVTEVREKVNRALKAAQGIRR